MSSAPRSADLSPRAYPSVSLQRRKSTGIQYKSKRPAPGAAAPAPAAPAVPAVDDDEETCPVCTMPMELPFKTKCKHQFCYLCLKSVITRSNSYHGPTCPLCRAALDPAQLKTAEIEANLYLDDLKSGDGDYVWEYEGRNGFWLYEDATVKTLEEAYAAYMESLKPKPPAPTPAVDPAAAAGPGAGAAGAGTAGASAAAGPASDATQAVDDDIMGPGDVSVDTDAADADKPAAGGSAPVAAADGNVKAVVARATNAGADNEDEDEDLGEEDEEDEDHYYSDEDGYDSDDSGHMSASHNAPPVLPPWRPAPGRLHLATFYVGAVNYVVDFRTGVQYPENDPGRQRRVRRVPKASLAADPVGGGDRVKGVSGVRFK